MTTPAVTSRVTWYRDRVRRVTVQAPVRAHALASSIAAGSAARAIRSTYSGTLSRDLSRPRFLGPMRSAVGSTRRYARIESEGGKIYPRDAPFLAIHGRRVGAQGQGTRSTFGGPIVATVGPGRGSKPYVEHKPKHWAEAAIVTFRDQLPKIYRRLVAAEAKH